MFHVKHTQGESSGHTCVDIAEPQYVGLWRSQRPNLMRRVKQKQIYLFLFPNLQTFFFRIEI